MPIANTLNLSDEEVLLIAQKALDKFKNGTIPEVTLSRQDYIFMMEKYMEMFKHVSTCSR